MRTQKTLPRESAQASAVTYPTSMYPTQVTFKAKVFQVSLGTNRIAASSISTPMWGVILLSMRPQRKQQTTNLGGFASDRRDSKGESS